VSTQLHPCPSSYVAMSYGASTGVSGERNES